MKLPYERRKALVGFGFTVPFVIGFLALYFWPLIQSFYYSLNDLTITTSGFTSFFIGLDNYQKALFSDADFVRIFVSTFKDLAYQVPTILVFSLMMALVLNQKFHGRLIVRAVFFLPVIIASGVVIEILNGDVMSQLLMSGEKSSSMFQVNALTDMMRNMGLGESVVELITTTTNSIFELSWRSGVQILLFIAALQTVPEQLYEAADMDGCTAWERFWKITFPLLTPMLMVNLVYTIVDHFTSYSNETMRLILRYGSELKFSYSATLAWMYFVVIVVILAIVYAFVNKRVSYI